MTVPVTPGEANGQEGRGLSPEELRESLLKARTGQMSQAECQEELLRLRATLLAGTDRLRADSESYYYLCAAVRDAPTPAIGAALADLVARHGRAYVDAWKEVIAIGKRAEALLAQMARRSEVESQLDELETETAG